MITRNFSPETWNTLADVYEARITALENMVQELQSNISTLKAENERLQGELYMTRLMGSNQDALEAHIATQNFIHSKLFKNG
jgi:predicted RNase H-like nuclease (RuvC/YqgF family)